MQKYQEKTTVNKVKQSYSILNQAIKMAIAENGDVDGWNYGGGNSYNQQSAKNFWNYLKPHIKVLRDCGTSSECMSSDKLKFLNKSLHTLNYQDNRYYKIILLNGTLVWFRTHSQGCTMPDGGINNVCADIWIDTNGDLPPKQLGHDVFQFIVITNGLFSNNTKIENDICAKDKNGWGCSDYILKNGNMNYLR